MFDVIKTHIEDLVIICPKQFNDDRGYFIETYNMSDFKSLGYNYNWVQDNQSFSKNGVLRGLHYQRNFPQAKLIRAIEGEIFDVAVDLRQDSITYGKWFGVHLSGENNKQLLIPRGFAHGFLTISDSAKVAYKCDEFYHPEDEAGIIWNDSKIGIDWPIFNDNLIISDKDLSLPKFEEDIKSL